MANVQPIRKERPAPGALHAHAADQLRYIRNAMEGAGAFTAVPGWGGAATGVLALGASLIAPRFDRWGWLAVWLATLGVSIVIAVVAAHRKARRLRAPGGPARKFVRSFAPAMAAGGVLTFALFLSANDAMLPGMWLLLYGVAVVNAGSYSVRVVPALGLSAMAMGAAALLSPAGWGDGYMAAGFGLLNIGFGLWIARNYGG
jgi:hypothetical protein